MVQVLFDNKNVTGVTTNDKIVHLIWPGFTDEDISPFEFFLDAEGTESFGSVIFLTPDESGTLQAGDLEQGSDVLFHNPLNPLNAGRVRFTQVTREILFYKDPLGRLQPLRFVKFPEIHYDEDSNQISLFYWTNVPIADLEDIASEGGTGVTNSEQNFDIITKAAEPFLETGAIDETLQRVLVFTRGEQANLYDNRAGGPTLVHRPSTFIFSRPQLVLRPGLFDESNTAEPVLDIHTGGATTKFLEFRSLPGSP